jgi:Recombinase zinc beta ribbon domain
VVEQSNNKKGRYSYYACHRRRHYGTCENGLRVSVAEVNEAVLQAMEEHVLTPEAIDAVIDLSQRDDVTDQQTKLDREGKDIEKRIKRIVAAIETGGDSAALVSKLHELERRQKGIQTEIANLYPIPRHHDQSVIGDRLAEWRRLLRQSTTTGRTTLQRILHGRITFTPREDGNGYDFSAETRKARLFTGIASPRPTWMPRGPSGVENPHDEDYGRLLDRFCGKGVVRPAGIEPATLGLEGRCSIL